MYFEVHLWNLFSNLLNRFAHSAGPHQSVVGLLGCCVAVFWSFERPFLDFGCILGPFWAPPGPFFDEFASFFDHVFDVIFSSLLPFFCVFLGICGGSGGLVLLVILVLLVGGWVE